MLILNIPDRGAIASDHQLGGILGMGVLGITHRGLGVARV